MPHAPSSLLPVDEEAHARRPTAEPSRVTGKQEHGEIKPIVFVELDETSILHVVLAVGRLTQINLNGKVDHVAFSDFERFRFDYKDGMIFVSPGTKDAALVDWKKVRADLAIVLDDGRQCHFEFTVVDSSRPSHRVINVNAPPPRRVPTEAEIEARAAELRLALEEREREEARRLEEERRRRDEAFARAAAQPLTGTARRGPLEIGAGGPLEIDGSLYVRFAVTNRSKKLLPLTVTLTTANGQALPSQLHFPSRAAGPKETVTGLVVVSSGAVPAGVGLTLTIAAMGAKPVEYRFDKQGR
jgi:hypothetical protein